MSDTALEEIIRRLERLEKVVFGKGQKPSRKPAASSFSGATGGIRSLLSKGFFKKKQGLPEVRAGLSKSGYHYSRQAVNGALNNLARTDGPLVSLQEGGRKVYVERK
jgi:hypothetical protein